jgi:TonB family protein
MIGGSRQMRNHRSRSWLVVAAMLTSGVLAQDEVLVDHTPAGGIDRVPLHTVVPGYPEKARRARVEGEVEVCFEVDRNGKTRRVAVRRSTNRVFEKPARDAVKASTYKPLEDDQALSGIKTCRTFRFMLQPVEAEDEQH